MINYGKYYPQFTTVGKDEPREHFLIISREFMNENIFV